MSESQSSAPPLVFRFFLIVMLMMLTAGLAYSVITLPLVAPGLSVDVAENLELSGVKNPVTAVLLNYRAYDTLLELGVLLLALMAVWSLGTAPRQSQAAPGELLDTVSRLLVPTLILVAGYLLWIGAKEPGGAFQAGAVLGASGVLLMLSGWQPDTKFQGLTLRVLLVAGLATFILIGLAFMFFGARFLEFPPSLAPGLILVIEAAATLSIAVALVALFAGGRPDSEQS